MKKFFYGVLSVIIIFMIAGCKSELSKDDLEKYYTNLGNTYGEGLIPVYKNYDDEKVENNYKKALAKLQKLEQKYDSKKIESEYNDLYKDLRKLNTGMIKEFEKLVDGVSDTEQANKDGQLMAKLADSYFSGKYPKKFDKFLSLVKEDAEKEASSASYQINNSANTGTSEPSTTTKEVESKGDITKISETPTIEQKENLQSLAEQQFSNNYPFKGSKIHSVLGVIQDWTKDGDRWFYKAEATIVNAAGAKRDCNVEIYIEPTGSETGNVTIIDY